VAKFPSANEKIDDNIIDFVSKRAVVIEEKRRQFERVAFNEFCGVYVQWDEATPWGPIKLNDISTTGCQIETTQVSLGTKVLKPGQQFSLRLYFTKHSFLTALCTIKHVKATNHQQKTAPIVSGVEFDRSTPGYKGIEAFVNFIYSFAEHSTVDQGDLKSVI